MWSKDGLFLQWRHISFFKQLSTYLHCHERTNNCIFSTRSTEMGARHAWDIKLLNKRTTNITTVHTGMPSEQDITKFNPPLLLSSSYFSHSHLLCLNFQGSWTRVYFMAWWERKCMQIGQPLWRKQKFMEGRLPHKSLLRNFTVTINVCRIKL